MPFYPSLTQTEFDDRNRGFVFCSSLNHREEDVGDVTERITQADWLLPRPPPNSWALRSPGLFSAILKSHLKQENPKESTWKHANRTLPQTPVYDRRVHGTTREYRRATMSNMAVCHRAVGFVGIRARKRIHVSGNTNITTRVQRRICPALILAVIARTRAATEGCLIYSAADHPALRGRACRSTLWCRWLPPIPRGGNATDGIHPFTPKLSDLPFV